jgi:hypothetical protein
MKSLWKYISNKDENISKIWFIFWKRINIGGEGGKRQNSN